jgi:hypothetical protein
MLALRGAPGSGPGGSDSTMRPRFSPSSSLIRCSMVRSARSGAGLRPTRRITSRVSSNSCSRHSPAVRIVGGGADFIFSRSNFYAPRHADGHNQAVAARLRTEAPTRHQGGERADPPRPTYGQPPQSDQPDRLQSSEFPASRGQWFAVPVSLPSLLLTVAEISSNKFTFLL